MQTLDRATRDGPEPPAIDSSLLARNAGPREVSETETASGLLSRTFFGCRRAQRRAHHLAARLTIAKAGCLHVGRGVGDLQQSMRPIWEIRAALLSPFHPPEAPLC